MADSPTWKKPSDVMRIHRRKSLLSARAVTSNSQKGTQQIPLSVTGVDGMSQNLLKRKNPFSCTSAPIKRLSMDDMSLRSESNGNSNIDGLQGIPPTETSQGIALFKCLTESDAGESKSSFSESVVEVSSIAEFGSSVGNSSSETDHTNDKLLEIFSVSKNEKISARTKTIPSDWSLRTKARFISSTPFTCASLLRSVDEALGITAFVQNIRVPLTEEQAADGSIAKQLFQRHLMFWLHPNIPWMQTFPRIVNSNKQMQSGSGITENVREALQTDWSESMNAAYQNIRAGLCSYMFVCCHHVTILFRASGTCGSHVTAVMTPTTRGLRESLRMEGIEFRLPLHKEAKMNRNLSEGSSQPDILGEDVPGGGGVAEKEENDKDDAFTDDSAVTWLEDLGLDRKRYRSVEPSKVKDQRDRFREIDHRPESTVLVEGGADVQAFFNYLLNSSSLTPSTGVQAGLPPTILSPVAFKGASLQSLKVRQGSILRPDSRGQQHSAHSVEITGPLMPQSLSGLVQLFSRTQPEFTATFSVHEPTVPFNCDLGYDDEQCNGLETVLGPGVHVASLGKTAVRELTLEEDQVTLPSEDIPNDYKPEPEVLRTKIEW